MSDPSSPIPNEDKKRKDSHLEGGWGWMVCFGAFMVHILTVGQQNCAGVIYSQLVDEFNTKRAETAWVTCLSSSIMYLFAPISTALGERFGCRKVVIVGGVLAAISMALSSFVRTLMPMYFTYGLAWGIGTSFGLFPSLVMLTKYFRRRLALVTGIALSGAAVGGVALSPLVQKISSKFGVPNMFRFLAALNVLMIFSGLLYRPLNDEKIKRDVGRHRSWKVTMMALMRHKGFMVWLIALCTLMIVFLVPFVHLVKLAEDMHSSKDKAALLATCMPAGGFLGSLFFGRLSDHPRCNRVFACQFAILSMGVVCTLVTIASSFTWLMVLAFAFGVFDGCYEMLVPVITSDIVGFKLAPTAIGTLYCILAIPKTIGPPVAGWIFDVSNSYNTAFYVTGGLMTLSSIIMFLIPKQHDPVQSDLTEWHLIKNSELSSTSTNSAPPMEKKPPRRKLAALACYTLQFNNDKTIEDYYTITTQDVLLVTEKMTSV